MTVSFPPLVSTLGYQRSARLLWLCAVMEPPCKKYLWRHGGVFAHALNKLLRIAKHDKVIKLPNKVRYQRVLSASGSDISDFSPAPHFCLARLSFRLLLRFLNFICNVLFTIHAGFKTNVYWRVDEPCNDLMLAVLVLLVCRLVTSLL